MFAWLLDGIVWFCEQLFKGLPSKDEKRCLALIGEVAALRKQSQFQTIVDALPYIEDMLVDAAEHAGVSIGNAIGQPLLYLVGEMLRAEDFLYNIESDAKYVPPTLEDAMLQRRRLTRAKATLQNETMMLAIWRGRTLGILVTILEALPAVALADPKIDGTEDTQSILSGSAPLYSLIDDFSEVVQMVCATISLRPPEEDKLFQRCSVALEVNMAAASGIPFESRWKSSRPIIAPNDNKKLSDKEKLYAYLHNTDFIAFFEAPIAIPIPQSIRYEHTHILAGTGHGKTQTLQYLIADDLRRGLEEELCSIVVLDPQGDLIKTVSRSGYFRENLYGMCTYIIDPSDIDFPLGLNLFDVGFDDDVDARTRETIQNNTIDFFEYFFSALLGSELTGKQGTLFRYIGILMMQIPKANITTLIDLMEHGEKYKPYIAKLTGSARQFFDNRFFDASFRETKKQIAVRLYGVLSSQTLDRMFSARKNSINFYDALQDGSVILVNTATDFLGQQSSEIFARLIIALIGQALIRRAAVEPSQRVPTYLYIDEAAPLIDDTLVRMLTQVRKYKGAITFSHQYLDQVPATYRAGILASTSIKLAGGISQKDAVTLAPEFRTDTDFLLSVKKKAAESEFALFARNATAAPLKFRVPFGFMENGDRLTDEEYEHLLFLSRINSRPSYDDDDVEIEATTTATPPASVSPTSEAKAFESKTPAHTSHDVTTETATPQTTEAVNDLLAGLPPLPSTLPASTQKPEGTSAVEVVAAPVVHKEGGGGVKHKYLEQLVRELGEQSGWHITQEETVLEGTGRIDVVARRGQARILVEISVTTTKEHEYANIQKCLEFAQTLEGGLEHTHVLLVASYARHLTSLKRHIEPLLTSSEKAVVRFLLPDELSAFFDALAVHTPAAPTIVKGYKVRSKVVTSSPDEAIARRRAVAQVIANSEFKHEVNTHL